MRWRWLVLALLLSLLPSGALAHVPEGGAGSVMAGLLHPVTGIDHVVAMVAVGLWGAVLGAPAIWLLPGVCRSHWFAASGGDRPG